MSSGLPFWLKALLCLASLVPIVVYVLIIANVGDRVASSRVRKLRPPLLMLLLAPGVVIGHGISVLPMLPTLVALLGAGSKLPGYLAFNAIIWLCYSVCGFLAELWVARRRASRQDDERQRIVEREADAALRELVEERDQGDPPSV